MSAAGEPSTDVVANLRAIREEASKRRSGQPTVINWTGFDLVRLLDIAIEAEVARQTETGMEELTTTRGEGEQHDPRHIQGGYDGTLLFACHPDRGAHHHDCVDCAAYEAAASEEDEGAHP